MVKRCTGPLTCHMFAADWVCFASFCKFYALSLTDLMFVLPQMTVHVLRALVIALLFTVSTGLVFPCSKNPALFRLMPTHPGHAVR